MDRLATAPYTREFVTESPVLGQVREQFADLEQSSFKSRNDHFLGARSSSHLSSECLKRTQCLLIKHDMHILGVYTSCGHQVYACHEVTDVDGDPLVKSPLLSTLRCN